MRKRILAYRCGTASPTWGSAAYAPAVGRVTEAAERLWRGELALDENPFMSFLGLEELVPELAFVSGFANVTAFATSDGVLLVDTGSFVTGPQVAADVGAWTDRRVHTAIYTHGHVDHAMGINAIERAQGSVRVVAHEAVVARFERYRLTSGYNGIINARQFRVPGLQWPTNYRLPDLRFARDLELTLGGERFCLHHDRGETDDHVWVWAPERKALCTGDLFIWAAPNCGNPQKVQRYPREWAAALRKMEALGAELLLPGHGPPILGADRVRQALAETAELLETLVAQTLELMNAGASLDEVLRAVRAPDHLLERPYLRPVYDEPEFVVRNLWRLYGGWYDGNPARLKPAPDAEVAREVARLSGGPKRLADHATELSDLGEHRLACHFAEMASLAAPQDRGIRKARAAVYGARAAAETSLMAKSVFRAAAKAPPGGGRGR